MLVSSAAVDVPQLSELLIKLPHSYTLIEFSVAQVSTSSLVAAMTIECLGIAEYLERSHAQFNQLHSFLHYYSFIVTTRCQVVPAESGSSTCMRNILPHC